MASAGPASLQTSFADITTGAEFAARLNEANKKFSEFANEADPILKGYTENPVPIPFDDDKEYEISYYATVVYKYVRMIHEWCLVLHQKYGHEFMQLYNKKISDPGRMAILTRDDMDFFNFHVRVFDKTRNIHDHARNLRKRLEILSKTHLDAENIQEQINAVIKETGWYINTTMAIKRYAVSADIGSIIDTMHRQFVINEEKGDIEFVRDSSLYPHVQLPAFDIMYTVDIIREDLSTMARFCSTNQVLMVGRNLVNAPNFLKTKRDFKNRGARSARGGREGGLRRNIRDEHGNPPGYEEPAADVEQKMAYVNRNERHSGFRYHDKYATPIDPVLPSDMKGPSSDPYEHDPILSDPIDDGNDFDVNAEFPHVDKPNPLNMSVEQFTSLCPDSFSSKAGKRYYVWDEYVYTIEDGVQTIFCTTEQMFAMNTNAEEETVTHIAPSSDIPVNM